MSDEVTVTGLTEALAELEHLKDAGGRARDIALPAIADHVLNRAQELAPRYYEQGGALPESLHVEQRPDGIAVASDLEWAMADHEDLTRKHRFGGPKFLERAALEAQDDPRAAEAIEKAAIK